jgi:hypothetical protein
LFYDTEFLEDGYRIDLISIGIVAESGEEYYAINADLDVIAIREHSWLSKNVWPSLPKDAEGWLDQDHPDVKLTGEIAIDVRQFIGRFPDPQLWAWYGAYDHVALAQMFGRMVDLPVGIPMWTNDLRQECERLGNPRLPEQQAGQHNALEDARHNLVMARALDEAATRG